MSFSEIARSNDCKDEKPRRINPSRLHASAPIKSLNFINSYNLCAIQSSPKPRLRHGNTTGNDTIENELLLESLGLTDKEKAP